MLRISWSEDPRAIDPMLTVLADTAMYAARGSDPHITAADFLGRMRDTTAIPTLRRNLELTRWSKHGGDTAEVLSRWDWEVRLACAAALWRLGEIQDALRVFRRAVAEVHARLGYIPRNVKAVVSGPVDIYQGRPGAIDSIEAFFASAAISDNMLVDVAAAARLIGVDTELAFAIASKASSRIEPPTKDWHWYVVHNARVSAVSVLGAIGDAGAMQVLERLAHDPDRGVREAAESALRDIARRLR